ncbi:hypothetical protein CEXT_294221 [Caerostris extrusa]|uniref:Uncharacterized protein n=1 Tax=Caerostris extrusa TaxID=172846 RepID=A0AAV4S4J9_CAEEX|nr:hypothetical protein CEXT_294221 [Caerostris extrusa]
MTPHHSTEGGVFRAMKCPPRGNHEERSPQEALLQIPAERSEDHQCFHGRILFGLLGNTSVAEVVLFVVTESFF